MTTILIFLALVLIILLTNVVYVAISLIYIVWTTDYTYVGRGLKWNNKLKTYGPGR